MIWIMLATLAVVFVVGFRVLTSGARKAIRRLSDRLNIDVVPVESMVDQMGKSAGDEFLRYLHRPDESHLQNAAQVLLIWQIVIVDGSEQNLLQWHRILQKARLAAPITDAQVRLALGFLRETEPEMQDINAFQMRYNAFFQRYIVGLRYPLIQCGNQCGEYSRLFRLGRDCTGDSVTRFCWCQTLYARIKRKNY